MKNTALTSKSRGRKKHANIFIRILKSPFKALLKVSQMYMNSMSSCAHELDQNGAVVANFSFAPQVAVATAGRDPKREEDLDELIRAVSKKLNADAVRAEQQRAGPAAMEKRSYSVGIGTMGRIDEDLDEPCEFNDFRLR